MPITVLLVINVAQVVQQRHFIYRFNSPVTDKRLGNAVRAVHKFIAKTAPVAQEATVHLTIVPVGNATQLAHSVRRQWYYNQRCNDYKRKALL